MYNNWLHHQSPQFNQAHGITAACIHSACRLMMLCSCVMIVWCCAIFCCAVLCANATDAFHAVDWTILVVLVNSFHLFIACFSSRWTVAWLFICSRSVFQFDIDLLVGCKDVKAHW